MTKRYIFLLGFLLVCGTAFGQTQPRLIINEFLADPASGEAGDANGDGTRSAQTDEFVELANMSRDTLDLTGWRVGDDETVNFTFPEGYKLPPRQLVVIFGGGDVSGVPGYDADPLQTRVFIAPNDSIGNGFANGGEAILLLSPDGAEDSYVAYGSVAANGGPTAENVTRAAGMDVTFESALLLDIEAGSADASVTRSPDGSRAADAWAVHNTVGAANFSPGTTIDGQTIVPKVTPPLTVVINEVLIDPPGSAAVDLQGDANQDGVRHAQADEFVELANISDAPVDLSGFTLGDDENFVSFTFPQGYVLQPRAFVTVFGGGDVSNMPGYDADPLLTNVFVVDSLHHGGIGNGFANGGDIALLLSPDGSYDTYFAYGSLATGEGPAEGKYPAGTEFEIEINTASTTGDMSVTRFPDGSTVTADPFVPHGTVSEAVFSPNATIDGRTSVPGPTPPITVVVNEILAGATVDANGDGTVSATEDQFIEIVNTSETEAVDLSGWQVGDAGGVTFTFPDGYTLEPRTFVAVFGGGDVSGVPGYDADPLQTRVFAASGALGDGLDASGDYAVVLSPDGSYDSYVAYGSASGAGDPEVAGQNTVVWEFLANTAATAGAGVSITRSPDGDYLSPDPFVAHTAAGMLPYSPAQTITGLGGLDDFVDVPHPWGTGGALHFRRFERDRVEIRTSSAELPLRLEEGTIEFWFKPDSVITHDTHGPDWTYIIGKNRGGATDPGDLGIAFPRGKGNLQFYMNDDQRNQDEVWSSDNDKEIFYPRWYHVAVSWKVGEKVRMFIDGELRDEAESTMPLLSGDQVVMLGNGGYNLINSSIEGFPGMLDEIRISATQRYTESFQTASEPFEPDAFTVGLWHFDEGSGDVTLNAVDDSFLIGYLGGTNAQDEPDPASMPQWIDVASLVDTEDGAALPERFELAQNYPNPFNPLTTLQYTVPRAADVELGVYNVLGQRVQMLVNQRVSAGTHAVQFDGSQLASGVYFYVLRSADVHLVRKMVLMK